MTKNRFFIVAASWWATAALLSVQAVVYIMFLFGQSPYPAWKEFLFRSPAGMALYCALILNIALASLRILLERFTQPRVTAESINAMDAQFALPAGSVEDLNRLIRSLERLRFKVMQSAETVVARRKIFSVLPGTVTRAGLIILLAAVLLSAHARKKSDALLHEGETMKAFGRQTLIQGISSDMPTDFLQVGEDASFRLRSVKALIQAGGKAITITPGFPQKLDGIYYRIAHFGLALPLGITTEEERVDRLLDLDILPPGRTDSVAFPEQKLFMTVRLGPDRVISKGLVKGREYNLRMPLFHVLLQGGQEKSPLGELDLREGQTGRIDKSTLSLGTHTFYLNVEAIDDPALPLVYAGAAIFLVGLLLMPVRFFWYEEQLQALLTERELLVGYREEFFKKWGIVKFYDLKDDITGMTGRDD